MGQQTDRGSTQDTGGAHTTAPESEDVPYIPRVFAFDPTVSAELRDQEPDEPAPEAAGTSPVPEAPADPSATASTSVGSGGPTPSGGSAAEPTPPAVGEAPAVPIVPTVGEAPAVPIVPTVPAPYVIPIVTTVPRSDAPIVTEASRPDAGAEVPDDATVTRAVRPASRDTASADTADVATAVAPAPEPEQSVDPAEPVVPPEPKAAGEPGIAGGASSDVDPGAPAPPGAVVEPTAQPAPPVRVSAVTAIQQLAGTGDAAAGDPAAGDAGASDASVAPTSGAAAAAENGDVETATSVEPTKDTTADEDAPADGQAEDGGEATAVSAEASADTPTVAVPIVAPTVEATSAVFSGAASDVATPPAEPDETAGSAEPHTTEPHTTEPHTTGIPAAEPWVRPEPPTPTGPPNGAGTAATTEAAAPDLAATTAPDLAATTAMAPVVTPPIRVSTVKATEPPAAVEATAAMPAADTTTVFPPDAVGAGSVGAVGHGLVSGESVGDGPDPEGAEPGDTALPTSPLDGFGEDDGGPRRGWVRALAWTGIAVVVVGGLYTGAQWYFSDKVPRGTTVAGVEIGGKNRVDAIATLKSELGPRAVEPVTLAAGEKTSTLDPATAGLTFDAQATAEDLTAFSMNPVRLWEHLVGGDDSDPVVHVDEKKLDAAVAGLTDSLEVAAVDGTVQFVDGAPAATPAADGAALVMDEVPTEIADHWLVSDKPVPLSTKAVAPAITQAETDAALAQAKKVVSAPVVVEVGGQSAELPVEVLAAAASFPASDGALTLTFDGAQLSQAVVERTTDLLTEADDAHFEFVNGAPTIVGGAPGTTIDQAGIAAAVTTAAAGDARTAPVELVESDPAQSVQALEALGIKEKVSEFATPLINQPIRTKNLEVGASKVNGTLIRPGEVFSLTDTLSPITIAGGYYSAGIVQDGKHVEGVGGGLSQMATTSYNAGYFAGLEDVEHRPHSYWFSRYPAGREATMFVGSLDMKFKNDTPYGLLMQSWVGDGQLHVVIWSTKYYTVETSDSGHIGRNEPGTTTASGPDCVAMSAGNAGFSIKNYRKVYLDGKLVKDETYSWTYKPDNAVRCEP